MSAEPVAVHPCGWRWLDSWIFRRRVPSYSTPSEWGPVYDRATLDAAVAAARAEERERQSKLENALWRLLDGSQHCGEMQWCGMESESPWEAARAAIRDLKPD